MRKKLTPQDIDGFLKAYGRKGPRGEEPNDRKYSRQLEERIKHLDPQELDALMRGEDDRSLSPDVDADLDPPDTLG